MATCPLPQDELTESPWGDCSTLRARQNLPDPDRSRACRHLTAELIGIPAYSSKGAWELPGSWNMDSCVQRGTRHRGPP